MANAAISITKGTMFQAADAVLATPPPGKTLEQWYQQLRQDLIEDQDSLSALAAEVGVISGASELEHVDEEALGDGSGSFWPTIPNKEEILREGFIAAYDFALSKNPTRPIVTFWVVVGEPDVFEVVLAASPGQITLFWTTSPPPGFGSCRGRIEESLWLVASTARIATVRGRYADPSRPEVRDAGADDTPPRTVAGVQILHLWGD